MADTTGNASILVTEYGAPLSSNVPLKTAARALRRVEAVEIFVRSVELLNLSTLLFFFNITEIDWLTIGSGEHKMFAER